MINNHSPNSLPSPKELGFSTHLEKKLYYLYADNFIREFILPDSIDKFFMLILVNALKNVQNEEIQNLAHFSLKNGMVYLISWGVDCSRIHDVFDEEFVCSFQNPHDDETKTIMTTWHTDDTIEEVFHFGFFSAWPADFFFDDCKSILIVNLGDKDNEEKIIHFASNPKCLAENL